MELDGAGILPSVPNLIMVTLMAVLGITLLKYIFSRVSVPGLSELVAAV